MSSAPMFSFYTTTTEALKNSQESRSSLSKSFQYLRYCNPGINLHLPIFFYKPAPQGMHTHHHRVCTLTTTEYAHSPPQSMHTHHHRVCTLTTTEYAHSPPQSMHTHHHRVCTLTTTEYTHSPPHSMHTHQIITIEIVI